MPNLELKIPPVVVWFAVAAAMGLAARAGSALDFPLPFRRSLVFGFAFAGVFVAVLGVVSFRRAGTTVNPLKPDGTSALVVSGIYRVTRNPMYLGMLLVLLGLACYLGNVVAFLLLPSFALYLNRFQIAPEEKVLTVLFGAEFTTYRATVRRWL